MHAIRPDTKTVYSQANGVYRFPLVPPAFDYNLTFQLEGFKTIIQTDLQVRVGGNTAVNVGMELSTVEETVTVTGTSPIVDVKKTNLGANVTEEYMQNIPSARDPWVMLEHTLVWRVRVGLSYGFGEDLVGGFDPEEWLAAVVPGSDEAMDGLDKGVDTGEAATPDGLRGENTEPGLHLIHPGSGSGREVAREPGVLLEPDLDVGLLVGAVVVQHQVDFAVGVGAIDQA